MINGIWKNIIYPKFYTLSIHVPASEDLQSEVMSLIKPTDTTGKKRNALKQLTSSSSLNQKLQISSEVLSENSCAEFHLIFKISLK